MFSKIKSVDPAGKFRFFKLLSIGSNFYNCDFYEHSNQKGEAVFNVKVECPDKTVRIVQLVNNGAWMPVKAEPGIGDELISQMNTVIRHNSSDKK